MRDCETVLLSSGVSSSSFAHVRAYDNPISNLVSSPRTAERHSRVYPSKLKTAFQYSTPYLRRTGRIEHLGQNIVATLTAGEERECLD